MPHCEMCGDDVDSLQTAKVSGAELDVCDSCSEFGTTLDDGDDDEEEQSTKYSTSSSSDRSQSTPSHGSSSGSGQSDYGSMPGQLAPNYGELIRDARTSAGHSIDDLANHLNEKASHLRKVEQGKRQPDNNLQARLEDFLGVDLGMQDDFDPSQDDTPNF